MQISARALAIEPFYVLEVAKAAAQLAQTLAHTDAPMVFLNIGEPDFTAPPLVQQAATQALQDGLTQYTPALGLMPLRERIADWYATRFGVQVPASRIVITAGASAALSRTRSGAARASSMATIPAAHRSTGRAGHRKNRDRRAADRAHS